jgi:hypothetical protein
VTDGILDTIKNEAKLKSSNPSQSSFEDKLLNAADIKADNQDQMKVLAAQLGNKYDYGAAFCGPLSAQILKNAGLFDGKIQDLYNFNPYDEMDKINKLFPQSKFTQINKINSGISIGDSKVWEQTPLKAGDFMYLGAKSLHSKPPIDTFEHMLVVSDVDSQGRAYSTTNYTTDGGKTHIVERVLLYDPTNTSNPNAMFNKWTNSADKNQYGNTGHDGFLIVRPLESTIDEATQK